jgi:hypothetical protein
MMQIKFQVTGTLRKKLVVAIGEIVGAPPMYKGPPTFSYAIGELEVDKDGTLIIDERTMDFEMQAMLESLQAQGFTPTEMQPVFEETHAATNKLTIELPIAGFTESAISNLQQILTAREPLIKTALGIDDPAIEQTAETILFPWFDMDTDGDHVKAYTHFISALCQMAKNQKRVSVSIKDAPNEKYAFRCFLLRLGFIGAEYKATRKILLEKLEGSSAFKNGSPTNQEVDNE